MLTHTPGLLQSQQRRPLRAHHTAGRRLPLAGTARFRFRLADLLTQPADAALRDDPVYADCGLAGWRVDRERTAEAERRERLKAAGTCVDCRRAPAAADAYRYADCLERQRRRVAATAGKGRDVTLDVTLP